MLVGDGRKPTYLGTKAVEHRVRWISAVRSDHYSTLSGSGLYETSVKILRLAMVEALRLTNPRAARSGSRWSGITTLEYGSSNSTRRIWVGPILPLPGTVPLTEVNFKNAGRLDVVCTYGQPRRRPGRCQPGLHTDLELTLFITRKPNFRLEARGRARTP